MCFFNDLLPVRIHSMETNKELICNKFAAVAFGHQLYNLQLPLTQTHLWFVCATVVRSKEEAGIACSGYDRGYLLFAFLPMGYIRIHPQHMGNIAFSVGLQNRILRQYSYLFSIGFYDAVIVVKLKLRLDGWWQGILFNIV